MHGLSCSEACGIVPHQGRNLCPVHWQGDYPQGLPLWLSWKRIHLQCGRPGFDPWIGKIPWRRERLPTPVFWPGEFHGLHRPWGRKEPDTTEGLALCTLIHCTIKEILFHIFIGQFFLLYWELLVRIFCLLI